MGDSITVTTGHANSRSTPGPRHASSFVAGAAVLIALAVLAGGCSTATSARATRAALRPELHEVAPNEEPDCIALVTQDPTAATGALSAIAAARAGAGCSACACRDGDRVALVPQEGATPRAEENGDAAPPQPEEELQRLMDGNKRFAEGEAENLERWPKRPHEAEAPRPKAMVLACSDWELLPEAAFDVPPGELFVVRVAGNVADAAVIESARYAVERYDIPLIVVLGHEDCGAVQAAVHTDEAVEGRRAAVSVPRGEERAEVAHDAEGRLPEVVPAAEDATDVAVQANVDEVVDHLREADPALSRLVADGKLKIVGAFYDGSNGLVTLQEEGAKTEVTEVPRE